MALSYRRFTSREQFDNAKIEAANHRGMIKDIVKQLTIAEQENIDKAAKTIILKHCEITRTAGFLYKGNYYGNGTQSRAQAPTKPPIAPELAEEWEIVFADQTSLDADKQKLTQGMSVLLRGIVNPQDIRDALPEPIVKILDGGRLLSYPRTRPEMYSLTSKLHKDQFERMKDTMYYYMASALFSE